MTKAAQGLASLELFLSASVLPREAYLQQPASRTRMEWEGRSSRWLGSEHRAMHNLVSRFSPRAAVLISASCYGPAKSKPSELLRNSLDKGLLIFIKSDCIVYI